MLLGGLGDVIIVVVLEKELQLTSPLPCGDDVREALTATAYYQLDTSIVCA